MPKENKISKEESENHLKFSKIYTLKELKEQGLKHVGYHSDWRSNDIDPHAILIEKIGEDKFRICNEKFRLYFVFHKK